MTYIWFSVGLALLLVATSLFSIWRPMDLDKLDDRTIRQYRLALESRQGARSAIANHVPLVFACMWMIAAVDHLVREKTMRGFAYLVVAVLFLLGMWLQGKARTRNLARLGDRGRVPPTAAENKAAFWYRLWAAIGFIAFVGASSVEYFYGDPLSGTAETIFSILSLSLIVTAVALLATYLNFRERESEAKHDRVEEL